MKKYLHAAVPLLSVLLCSLFTLTSLDNRVFDLFLRATPSLTENPSVLLVNVDDQAIENVGLWPWTRDILADAMVFMKELGAETVVFDLSYLDRSPVKVDPAYVKQDLPGYLDYGFSSIDETVGQVLDAFADGTLGPEDAESYKEEIFAFNRGIRDQLDSSISYVTRDLDEYFAKALSFFGDSYLTLTMVMSEDIPGKDKTWDMSAYDGEWLKNSIGLPGVRGEKDRLTKELPGLTPAIGMLMEKARGAGFVNALPDPDGYRRRVHLLYKWDGAYFGQLVFTPLLKTLGNPEVRVTNSAVTLKGAALPGGTRDIVIPRSQDGSVLVNWPKKTYGEYNQISATELINYNVIERSLVKNLSAMRDSGFFSYYGGEELPLDLYDAAVYLRDELSAGGNPESGITMDAWLDYRSRFFKATGDFLGGPTEESILALGLDESTQNFVRSFFETSRKQYGDMKALRERAEPRIRGSFAIIGVTATSMTDVGLTTYEEKFPNVGIHATLANMILSGQFLDDTPWGVSIFIALLISLALSYGIKRLDTKNSLFVGLGVLAASVLLLLLFFVLTRRYVGVVVPFASAATTFLALSAINFLTTARDKAFLRSAFSRYLSPAVISEIMSDPSKLNLGGEKREMTAIFTDLQGFSSISEKLDPADLVALLNRYLTAMSNIVLDNRGTLDKYEGDAIIAFFGAPTRMEEHAPLACRTAVAMKRAERELNREFLEAGLTPSPLFTRIGINTGEMIVGNMGTQNKMDYTIMGNAVNLAARLEGVNKIYRTGGILISEYTRSLIGEEFLVRTLDRVRVVGVNRPLRLYEILDLAADADGTLREAAETWESAMTLFEKRDWTGARKLYDRARALRPEDRVAQLYLEKCDLFLDTPPESDWDGVFNLTQKS